MFFKSFYILADFLTGIANKMEVENDSGDVMSTVFGTSLNQIIN
jgi:hypothetical protein